MSMPQNRTEGNHLSLSDWKEISRETQENLCEKLGNRIWDEYDSTEEDAHLFQSIGTALYGSPKAERDDLDLSDMQIKFIKSIQEKCKKFSFDKSKIRMSVIFVFVYNCNYPRSEIVPLFRVYSNTSSNLVNENIIIDHLGRVYKDLTKYIKENTWDMSWLCLPIDGYYSIDKLDEEFIQYIDQSSRGSKLKLFDKLSNVTNIASSIGLVGGVVLSMFPPTAPIGIAATSYSIMAGLPGAAYGTGRSVGRIIDRIGHQQSISLTDSEARQCWLNTATALVSVTALSSTKILSSLAKSGVVVSRTTRGVCTGISILNLSLSGTAVVNSGYELLKKPKGEITRLDVFNFSLSVLFFTHSVVKFKTAKSIIEEAQRKEDTSLKNWISKKHSDKFRKNIKRMLTRKPGIRLMTKMYRNAKLFRKMRKIYPTYRSSSSENEKYNVSTPIQKQEEQPSRFNSSLQDDYICLILLNTFDTLYYNEFSWHIMAKIKKRILEEIFKYLMNASLNTEVLGPMKLENADKVIQDQDNTLFCNSVAYLLSTCGSSNIHIPVRCLEVMLQKAEGERISRVQWKTVFKVDSEKKTLGDATDECKIKQIVECRFKVGIHDNYSVQFYISDNNFVMYTCVNGSPTAEGLEIHEM